MNAIERSETISNVIKKVIIVSQALGKIKKARMGGTSNNFEYFANEAVLAAVSDAMEDNGLWVMPSVTSCDVSELEYTFHYQMMVVDGDTGEYITLGWAQVYPKHQGQRINDKATGIAHSYAHKTFLLKLLMISTPDADTVEQNSRATNDRRLPAQPPKPAPQPAPVVDTTPADDSAARFDAIPSAYPDTAPIGESQHKRLMATLTSLGVSDVSRHLLIDKVTKERTQSSKALTIAEYEHLMKLLKLEEMGRLAGDKWTDDAAAAIVSSATNKATDDLYTVQSPQSEAVRKKIGAWLAKHHIEVPARFNTL